MEVIINIFYSFHLLLLRGAAIFDFLVGVGEDLPTSGADVWHIPFILPSIKGMCLNYPRPSEQRKDNMRKATKQSI